MWSKAEREILDRLGASLRARGWAPFVTVDWLLADWQLLSIDARAYECTVDDYTNDLTTRDALAIVLRECPEPLRTRLQAIVEEADARFRDNTVDDVEGLLVGYFRIKPDDGWWWRRIPELGPLADYLRRSS